MDELALREYKRIWKLHQERRAESQYDALGCQFALDYARFLIEVDEPEEARSILAEVLLRIDFDRNVDLKREQDINVRYRHYGISPGTTRSEFLVEAAEIMGQSMSELATSGELRLRTQAEIARIDGRLEQALELELGHLESLELDPFSKHLRLGLIYESVERPKLALAAYQEAFKTAQKMGHKNFKVNIPDARENTWMEGREKAYIAWSIAGEQRYGYELDTCFYHRLLSLKDDWPSPEESLRTSLERFGDQKDYPEHGYTASLQNIEKSFLKLRTEAEFFDWLQETGAKISLPSAARAAIYRRLEDWERYKPLRLQAAADLVETLEERNSDNPHQVKRLNSAKLALLRLRGESWTEKFKKFAFESNPSPETGEALVHFYGETGQADKLASLAKDLLSQDGVLKEHWVSFRHSPNSQSHRDKYGLLATILQYGESTVREMVEQFCTNHPDSAMMRPLAAPDKRGHEAPIVLNAPKTVRAILPRARYSCLASDNSYLYLGTQYGVDILSLEGAMVGKLAIGRDTNALVAHQGSLWVGSREGLFKVRPSTWSVHPVVFEDSKSRHSEVTQIGRAGSNLWFTSNSKLWRLDLRTEQIHKSPSKLPSYKLQPEFFHDGERLWFGYLLLPRIGGGTEKLAIGGQAVAPIAVADGQLWGKSVSEKEGLSLYLVDPYWMSCRKVEITGADYSRYMPYAGIWNQRPVFGSGNSFWHYSNGKLRPFLGLSNRGNSSSGAMTNVEGFTPHNGIGTGAKGPVIELPDGRVAFLKYEGLMITKPHPEAFAEELVRTEPDLGRFRGVIQDGKTTWAWAERGIAEITPGQPINIYDRSIGVRGGLVDGVLFGDRLYFGNGNRLVVFHKKSKLFTEHSLSSGVRGVTHLRKLGSKLEISYSGPTKEKLNLAEIDPITLEVEFKGTVLYAARQSSWSSQRIPFLKSPCDVESLIGGKQFFLGEGLLVTDKDWRPKTTFP